MSTLDRKFIDDVLVHKAHSIAKHVAKGIPDINGGHNDFRDFNYNKKPTWEIIDGGIKFNFGRYANVCLKNIRPAQVHSVSFGEAQRRNERTDSSNSVSLYNYGSESITRNYTITKENSITSGKSISTSITTGITQKISYGSDLYGVSGETEISTEISNAWESFVENSSTSGTEDSMEVVIPPKKRLQVTTNRSIADTLQPITVVCNIDFDIEFSSHGDFHVKFKSIADLERHISGLIPRRSPGHPNYHVYNHFVAKPISWRMNRKDLRTKITDEIEFQGATTGDVIIKEFDL